MRSYPIAAAATESSALNRASLHSLYYIAIGTSLLPMAMRNVERGKAWGRDREIEAGPV